MALTGLSENIMASNSISRDRVTVDVQGNWKAFLQIPAPYQEPKGTVQVGTDREGALLFDKQLAAYVMVDRYGRTLQLNQRKVRAALGEPEPVGKPRKGYEVRAVFSVSLEPSLAEYLRAVGGGSLSEGVNKVGSEHRSRAERRGNVPPVVTFPIHDPVYTAKRTVIFLALRDQEVIECEISGEALRDHFGASSMKMHDLLTSYITGKDIIQGIARAKLMESPGASSVLLTTEDFGGMLE